MSTETTDIKPPLWFWIVSGLALIWNLLGVMAFFGQATMSYETMVETFGQVEADMIVAQPSWYITAFAFAVLGGVLGCASLLLRKRWAFWFFLLSLICVFLQQIYIFFLSNMGQTIIGTEWIMTILVPIVAILLFMLARKATDKGWLR